MIHTHTHPSSFLLWSWSLNSSVQEITWQAADEAVLLSESKRSSISEKEIVVQFKFVIFGLSIFRYTKSHVRYIEVAKLETENEMQMTKPASCTNSSIDL